MSLIARWQSYIQNHIQSYSRREQIILLAGAAALFLYLLWFAVIQPLQSMVDQQQRRNIAQQQSLQAVTQLAAEYQALQKNSQKRTAGSGNLSQLVDKTLRQHRLKMSGFQPGRDGTVSVRFEKADFNQLMLWLYQLESKHQVQLDELTVRPAANSGFVTAQLRLRGVS